MIKFRQKQYSDTPTKVAYKINLAKANVVEPVKHKYGLVKKFRASGSKTPIKDAINAPTPKISKYKVARETISAKKNLQKLAFEAATNPGKVVSDTIQHTLNNPIAVGGTVAGYRYLVPGTTATSIAAEAIAKKKIPLYRKTTEVLGDKIYKRNLSRLVKPAVNAAVTVAKTL